jgi:hypothetical protein
MKLISPEKTQQPQKGLSEKIDRQFGTFLFWCLLIIIGLLAGFVYSWRISPDANLAMVGQPTQEEPTATPTMEPTLDSRIEALSVIALELKSDISRSATPGLQPAVSADLQINQGDFTVVQVNRLLDVNGDVTSWQLNLPQQLSDLPLSGTKFTLLPDTNGEAVQLWAYLQQLKAANISVPELSVCLLSVDNEAQQAAYLIQSEQSRPYTDGFIFQLPQEFFTGEPLDDQERLLMLEEIKTSVAANQSKVSSAVLERGMDMLDFLTQVPEEIPNKLDIERFASYYAIHDLWGVSYDDAWQEARYFYNDDSGKIEPILVDDSGINLSIEKTQKTFPFSSSPLFQFPQMQIAYVQALHNLTTDETYQAMRDATHAVFHFYEKQIRMAIGTPYTKTWDVLDFRKGMLELQTEPAYPIRGFVYSDLESDCVHVDFLNLMNIPVDVSSIRFMGEVVPVNPAWISIPASPAYLESLPTGLRLAAYQNPDMVLPMCIPSEYFESILKQKEKKQSLQEMLLDETAWTATANISGLDKKYVVNLLPQKPPQTNQKRAIPGVQSIQEITTKYPFIRSNTAGDTLTFLAGSWEIQEDLVIPAGYQIEIEAGTTLHFSSQAVFLSYSAIKVLGTEQAPVVFTSTEDVWPGMVVIKAGQSTFEHVVIENTSGISRQGWILTGGITFYRSPLDIRSSVIQNNKTEDAINIIRADFTFDQLTIRNTPSDAFDSDFADGTIVDCLFEDIGGDAIDISGANVHVSNSQMLHITDKGLSIGEESHLIADGLTMNDVGIGAAAKDLSILEIRNSVIQNAKVAGLAAYIKKAVFGPSSIIAEQVEIKNSAAHTLVQTGSQITLNGETQDSHELNVKTLYALGILGN